jgi:hypothetical protein
MQTSKLTSEDPVAIQSMLGQNKLAGLFAKARQLHAMQGIFQQLLPPELQSHCQIANQREQHLIIEVDTAAWGLRLGFLLPQLLAQCPREWRISKMTYYIRPSYPAPARKAPKPTISEANRQLLRQTAASLPDPKLSSQLAKLANL